MPTLNWVGKDKVINHHQEVPFRVLDHKYGYTPDGKQEAPVDSGNLIIHGDNLEALKALLPHYEAKVKCIYIDPPYNTGNEGWAYNDNVNDPKIKKWLHQVVGKEGEDLSRHDKWLCMMYPRLQLLYKLLSDNGSLWISIDDTEVHNLALVCEETFGKTNFVANVVWQKRTSPDARATIGAGHEHILVYAKKWQAFKEILRPLPLSLTQQNNFKNPDSDPRGPWVSTDFTAQGFRPNQMYTIITPAGRSYQPTEGRCWVNVEEVYLQMHNEGRMWYGNDGNGIPRRKTYLHEREGYAVWTWWPNDEVGHNQEAKKEVIEVFGSSKTFETPKPVRLLNRVLQLVLTSHDLVLDSFAGSGTTAHAVLNLNKQDGGNRKFILVEMEDYAETITAERVKRVINGYADVDGTGGSFDYYELGPPLFDDGGNLNEQVSVSRIREYVWYSETRSAFNALTEDQLRNPYFLGIKEDTGYYFFYEPQQVTTLDYDFLGTISLKAEQYVVYADNCLLSKTFLQNNNIIFKKIPRDVARL